MSKKAVWTISKKFTFEASHQLPEHDGKCRRLHGHSWVGWVEYEGTGLIKEGAKAGMLIDYGDIKAVVKPLVDRFLDHHHLNDTLPVTNPTSESIAEWLYKQLKAQWAGEYLKSVTIEETCTSKCTYTEK